MNRKNFLETTIISGFGLLCGGAKLTGEIWNDGGIRLTAVQRSSLIMGSVVSFEVVAEKEEYGYEAIRRAVAVFQDLDRKLSMYNANNEMGMLSENAGKNPVLVSEEAFTVLKFAKKMWNQTQGQFDVTIEPAMRRWGFRKNPEEKVQRPTDEELKKLECLIGSDKLILSKSHAFLEKPGMAVDLGGIAGGFALDKAIKKMKKTDIKAAFINFSGDIRCFGNPLEKNGWPVYILNPHTVEPLAKPVVLADEALSTSGAYQNRRKNGNDSWGHLLFPGSAVPADSPGSVTAIHKSALMADAWSTAAFVGAERINDVKWIIL